MLKGKATAMADEQAQNAKEEQVETPGGDKVDVQEAQLPEATDAPRGPAAGQIDILLDMSMPVSAQLGQVDMQVRELLQLAPGSVVKLDKQVGEPVDVLMRGTKFATGQLVVIGDQLGIRVKEILSSETGAAGEQD